MDSEDAKQKLSDFLNKHKDVVSPSYIIIGKIGDALNIETVPNDQSNIGTFEEVALLMKEVKLKYQEIISCSIYSLSPAKSHLKLSEIVSKIKTDLDEKFPINDRLPVLDKLGVLKNPEPLPDLTGTPMLLKNPPIHTKKVSPKALEEPQKSDASKAIKPKTEINSGLSSKYVSRKLKPAVPKHNVITDLSNKQNNTSKAKEAAKPTSGYKYVSRKNERSAPAEKVIAQNFEEEEDDEMDELEEEETEQQRKELEGIFDDNNFESAANSNEEVPSTGPSVISLTSKSDKATEPDITVPETVQPKIEEDPEQYEKYVDEDGYLVTKKAVKPKAQATSAKREAPIKSTSVGQKNKKQKQSSLLSFFGKN